MTLAYSLDRRWIQGAGLSALRVYVTLQNMFVISGYKGYSPELNVTSSANLATQEGFDHGTYPQAKSVTLGINVSL